MVMTRPVVLSLKQQQNKKRLWKENDEILGIYLLLKFDKNKFKMSNMYSSVAFINSLCESILQKYGSSIAILDDSQIQHLDLELLFWPCFFFIYLSNVYICLRSSLSFGYWNQKSDYFAHIFAGFFRSKSNARSKTDISRTHQTLFFWYIVNLY